MSRTPRTLRRSTIAVAASAGLAAAALMGVPSASAGHADDQRSGTPEAAPAKVAGEQRQAAAAARVADRIDSSAGMYYDAKNDRFVVNVTERSDLTAARSSGATPRLVTYSSAQLNRVANVLERRAAIPGTSWAMDPRTNKLSVLADRSVTQRQMTKLRMVTKQYGDKVSLRRVAGAFSPTIDGGEAIYSGGGRCSLGFNVTDGSSYYFLTAGHCGSAGSSWNDGGSTLGTMLDSSFPGNDYAIVSLSGPQGSGGVHLYSGYQDITSIGSAFVGQSVTRSGSTTGVFGGSVNATNATVNYAEGSVSGLIRTNVCAEPGDSGGSLFAGTTALGLTSGGSGNCSSGGTTFFQPVNEAASVYGVNVY